MSEKVVTEFTVGGYWSVSGYDVGADLAFADSTGRTSRCVITKVDRLRGTITVSG